ncbi:10909_t:CDS:2, partial [Scutellospora calospora]
MFSNKADPPISYDITNSQNERSQNEDSADLFSQSSQKSRDSKTASFPSYCLFVTFVAVIASFENGWNLGVTNIPDIMAVALGIRAAYLVDFTLLTLDESKTLLSSFQKNVNLFNICILQFSDTHTFICNYKLILTKLEKDLINEFESNVFVDVAWHCKEGGNKEPKVINTPSSFRTFLETCVKPFFSELSDFHLSSSMRNSEVLFIPTTPTCAITFTGWILEYPAIYVLDSVPDSVDMSFDVQTMKNCLGSQDLKLYRAFLKIHEISN